MQRGREALLHSALKERKKAWRRVRQRNKKQGRGETHETNKIHPLPLLHLSLAVICSTRARWQVGVIAAWR